MYEYFLETRTNETDFDKRLENFLNSYKQFNKEDIEKIYFIGTGDLIFTYVKTNQQLHLFNEQFESKKNFYNFFFSIHCVEEFNLNEQRVVFNLEFEPFLNKICSKCDSSQFTYLFFLLKLPKSFRLPICNKYGV